MKTSCIYPLGLAAFCWLLLGSAAPEPAISKPVEAKGDTRLTWNRIELKDHASFEVWVSEDRMNDYYVNLFIRTAGFGGGRMDAPRMWINPNLWLVLEREIQLDGSKITTIDSYKIDSLELIGIAKHDQPVGFVMDRHTAFLGSPESSPFGRMPSTPRTIQTRDLTAFEISALPQINVGKSTVTQTNADGSLNVTGAIRAQPACLECHSGYKVGDALGALSYRLLKTSLAVPDKKP